MGSQLLKLSVFSSGHVITTSGSNGASEQKLKRSILILKPLLSYYRRYWSAAPRRSWAILKSTSTDPFSKVAIMGPARALLADLAGWIRSFVADYWICISSIWCCNCMDANGCIDLGGLLRVTAGYGTKVSLSVGSDGQPDIIKEWQIEERQLRFASMVYLGEQYVKYPTLSDVTLMIEGERCKRYWETFEKMIRCIYTGSVEVDLRIAQDLLRAADQYLLDGQGTQERDHSSERIGMFSQRIWCCNCIDANGCIDLGGLLRVTASYGTKVSLSVGSDGQPNIIKEWQIEERQLRFASMVYLGEQYVNNPTLSDVTLMIEGKRFYAHIICLLASSDAFREMFDGGYRQGTQERDHSSERIGMFSQKLASSVTEEKTNTDKNMSTMFDVLRRNRTVKLETLVLKCKPWLMICQERSDYFPKIPHGLDPVYSMFKQHVAAEGTTLVKQPKDAASNKKVEKRLQVDPAT
ncbi:unnamed protein product [Lactuca saligna]|uniref:BTB domain-containing protein n=1 Tax=Lactuca saligna TaxID=75948 RepID=A0AA35V786_LACSI|nr:unnamed protein product [Lactuca saligna]